MNPRFQLATLAQLEPLLEMMELYYECDHLHFERTKAERVLREFLTQPEFGQLYAISDGHSPTLIGYLVLAFSYSFECGGREAFVDELFIRADYRGQGIGSQVLSHATDECRKIGIQAIRLEVTKDNADAAKLYRKLGFRDFNRTLLTYWVNPDASSELDCEK